MSVFVLFILSPNRLLPTLLIFKGLKPNCPQRRECGAVARVLAQHAGALGFYSWAWSQPLRGRGRKIKGSGYRWLHRERPAWAT